MNNNQQNDTGYEYQEQAIRASLSAQFVRVYGWMFLGLVISGMVAWLTASSALGAQIFSGPTFFILIIVELFVVMFLSRRAMKMSYGVAALAFVGYSALNGLTLSFIFLAYTMTSITAVFFMSAAFFGVMSVYGITTKQDLSKYSSLFIMGIIGILVASIFNFFMKSEALYWLISYAGVVVFLGLTAYDNQKIKKIHAAYVGTEKERNVGVVGALELYLDFINLFLFILRILGRRR